MSSNTGYPVYLICRDWRVDGRLFADAICRLTVGGLCHVKPGCEWANSAGPAPFAKHDATNPNFVMDVSASQVGTTLCPSQPPFTLPSLHPPLADQRAPGWQVAGVSYRLPGLYPIRDFWDGEPIVFKYSSKERISALLDPTCLSSKWLLDSNLCARLESLVCHGEVVEPSDHDLTDSRYRPVAS